MSLSIDQQINAVSDKLTRLKAKQKKIEKQKAITARKKRDHLKYLFAGKILKVLSVSVDKVDLPLVIGYLAMLENCNEEKKDFLKRKGLRVLDDWNNGE